MIRGRLPSARMFGGISTVVLSVVATSHVVGVVVLVALGTVPPLQAGLLLAAPFLLVMAVLRPEWTILILVMVPPSVFSSLPPMHFLPLLLAALFGFLWQGGLRLGPATGVYPLVGIITLAVAIQADTKGEAAATADGMLKLIIVYTLLTLVAYHAVTSGRLRIDRFLNAFLIGLVAALILQPFTGNITSFEAITYHPFRGQFAYLSAMGFGVTYVRHSLSRHAGTRPSALDAFLMVAFLSLTAIGFGRATWIAVLLFFALVSWWTGRKSFWIALSLSLALILTVPVVGERVLPGGSTDVTDVGTLARVTTGRSVLWTELWERGAAAAPLGQGWGYVWSLTSFDLFGFEGEFVSGSSLVYPHNDFLYLFVDLGIMGVGLLVVLWVSLLRRIRVLSRGNDRQARYDVRVIVPIIVVMLLVQLFDNGFAIRFVAMRFFIAAGLVCGLRDVMRRSRRWDDVAACANPVRRSLHVSSQR